MAISDFRAGSALALVLVTLSLTRADSPPIVHYAPAENLENLDVALLARAERRIDLAAYVLTDRQIISALIRAARRGVKIRIYTGARQYGGERAAPLLQELFHSEGVEIRCKRLGAPLMHLKSYQIDGRWLRTGAANFSASGLKRQDNDLLVLDSQAAARAFENHFDAIFSQGKLPPCTDEEQSP
ncbi:MAG: phosphatidylserine synthase [Methylocapsa sp.]|nr:phosphatidylserine synthase [Methylocapsa sp.]